MNDGSEGSGLEITLSKLTLRFYLYLDRRWQVNLADHQSKLFKQIARNATRLATGIGPGFAYFETF